MISGLIDELNKSADEWNGSNMFELARMCREAADTIWKLRDDLQRAHRENAKLREQSERLRTQLADVTKSVGRVEERCAKTFEVGKRWMAKAARFEAENAKLRELVRDLWKACPADGYYCIYHCEHYDKESESHCKLEDCMRDLGVEVDG